METQTYDRRGSQSELDKDRIGERDQCHCTAIATEARRCVDVLIKQINWFGVAFARYISDYDNFTSIMRTKAAKKSRLFSEAENVNVEKGHISKLMPGHALIVWTFT